MRKVIIAPVKHDSSIPTESWVDLENLATVEVTSEQAGYPVESVFIRDREAKGWRAADKGTQTIRLIFDAPQRIRRIWLLFEDAEGDHTQEFLLRWSADNGQTFQEIVRQQWNFSPLISPREIENYRVDLSNVTVLELIITPDNRHAEVKASLRTFLLA